MARRVFSALLSVSAVIAISSGWLWTFGVEVLPVDTLFTDRAPSYSVRVNEKIKAGGVSLGMSANAVRDLYSDLSVRKIAHGETVGEFTQHGIAHTLWFAGGRSLGAVYRMRLREYSKTLQTDEIHTRFAKLYGQPAAVECRQGSKVSRQGLCYLKWITRNGVSIEVASRNLVDAEGRGTTELTVTFTDVLVANKIFASRKSGRA